MKFAKGCTVNPKDLNFNVLSFQWKYPLLSI